MEIEGKHSPLQSSKRSVKFEGQKDSVQIYEDWLINYKKKNPGFIEETNKYGIDEKGHGIIDFSDPHAEEDFVRHLAANSPRGGILDKDILIAKFEDGKLIDIRTNEEFPEGGYAELVQKLDAGIAYGDIPSPQSTASTPFSTAPY